MMHWLALKDAWAERRIFFCYAAAVAAVLAPLLILYAMKLGVIGALVERMLADPRNLELIVTQNRQHDPAWLAALAERPEVGFLVPRTRTISTWIRIARDADSPVRDVQLVPSAPGDPQLAAEQPAPEGTGVALTHPLAVALDLGIGDSLLAIVDRTTERGIERRDLTLEVSQILALERDERPRLYMDHRLLEAIEAFRDGYAVEALGWQGLPAPASPVHASFRIFAAGLAELPALHAWLTREGVEVRSEIHEVRGIEQLARSLDLVFTVLAAFGGLGLLVAVGAMLWSNVDRKRHELSVMRLLGVTARQLSLVPVVQGWVVTLAGFALALVFYLLAARVIDALFREMVAGGRSILVLPAAHVVLWLGVLGAFATLAAAAAANRASRVGPSEGLRHV